jgi:hypothetical protein
VAYKQAAVVQRRHRIVLVFSHYPTGCSATSMRHRGPGPQLDISKYNLRLSVCPYLSRALACDICTLCFTVSKQKNRF